MAADKTQMHADKNQSTRSWSYLRVSAIE